MAFATLEDQSGKAELIIFPRTYESVANQLGEDQVILVRGKAQYEEEEWKILAEKISIPQDDEVAMHNNHNMREIFVPRKTTPDQLKQLGTLLKANLGSEKIAITIPNGEQSERIVLPYQVNYNEEVAAAVAKILS
jgi:DNA polymerase-3 subunit alpha